MNDAHGQPMRALWGARVDRRLEAEMIGLCKGVLADGVVSDAEAVMLAQWVAAHPEVASAFPGRVLHERLRRIFDDGAVDDDERADLEQLLRELLGEPEGHDGAMVRATRLDFDDPRPALEFASRRFCLTGRFAYGTRQRCEQAVRDRGGAVLTAPTQQTDYVVVGTYASAAWVQSTHGTKFLRARELRAAGHPVAIVAEEHWVDALGGR